MSSLLRWSRILSVCNSMIITMTEKCHHTPPEPKSTKAVWSRFQNFFLFFFFFLGYPLKLYQMNEKRELADWGHAPHISCRYIWCNVLNFDSPSHRDGRANRLHWDAQQGGEKKGEEEDQRPVSSSHTFPSNQSQIVWQLILIQATQTQLHKLYRRLHRPPTNRPHKLSCYDFIVQHSKFIYWLIDGIDFKQRCLFPSLRILFSKATLHYAAN